jgi:hypothetical protein
LAALRIEWEGKEYAYDGDKLDMPTAEEIQALTGWGLRTWDERLKDVDPVAVKCMYFAVLRQNGESVELADCTVKPLAFYQAYAKASKEAFEASVSEEAGKAQKNGRNRRTKTRSSEISETNTSSDLPTGAT